jgi:hypothetical protein
MDLHRLLTLGIEKLNTAFSHFEENIETESCDDTDGTKQHNQRRRFNVRSLLNRKTGYFSDVFLLSLFFSVTCPSSIR